MQGHLHLVMLTCLLVGPSIPLIRLCFTSECPPPCHAICTLPSLSPEQPMFDSFSVTPLPILPPYLQSLSLVYIATPLPCRVVANQALPVVLAAAIPHVRSPSGTSLAKHVQCVIAFVQRYRVAINFKLVCLEVCMHVCHQPADVICKIVQKS